jgi:hypothetical protein
MTLCLVQRLQPKQGDVVLVTGALGGVGRTAVYSAKEQGMRVIAGVRTKQKEEARSLAADQVIALDNDREISDLPELDAIADTLDGELIAKLIPRLKPGGVLGLSRWKCTTDNSSPREYGERRARLLDAVRIVFKDASSALLNSTSPQDALPADGYITNETSRSSECGPVQK